MPNLYPTINLPTLIAPKVKAAAKKNKVAPYFDYDSGTFLFDGAGRPIYATPQETFEQWCIKVVATERCSRLAYSDRIGTEMRAALKELDIDAVKSSIVRTITEAILVNSAAEYVKNFSFELEGDSLKVSFDVKGRDYLEPRRLSVKY